MYTIGNDIKVLYRRFNKEVLVEFDDVLGELHLYDNEVLLEKDSEFLLDNYTFTGISIEPVESIIKLNILDKNHKFIDFWLHKNFIYVKNTETDGHIAIINFTPKKEHWVGDSFYAHFIELD